MNKHTPRQNSPFLVADMLQPTSSMRPLIRLLAAQAVRNWQEQAQNNDKILQTGDKNEGSDLREV